MIISILILGQILLMALALGVIFHLIDKTIAKYNLRIGRKTRRYRKSYSKPAYVPRELIAKLGDAATAERLINQLRIKHPGKSPRWYAEKAIFDLERDKGRY